MNSLRVLILALVTVASALSATAAPEAVEIGPNSVRQLPGGKEADGIIGDFLLRNGLIEAVISANRPARKANMGTFWDAVAPGCLFDLTLRGANNDQLTVFAPCDQRGPVSFVRVVRDGGDGTAEVETVTTAANNNGLYVRHAYLLEEGWRGLFITTTLRNDSSQTKTGKFEDRWTTFTQTGKIGDVFWADAVDPADKAGYAYAPLESDGLPKRPEQIELEPGQSITFGRGVSVGTSPAQAVGIILAVRDSAGRLRGTLSDDQGHPVTTARIDINLEGQTAPAYPDAEGKFDLRLPPGGYDLRVTDIGRPEFTQAVQVLKDETTSADLRLGRAAAIVLDVRGEDGRSLPCKVQFLGIEGTASPDLGPQNRAHGCKDQYHSETGQFTVQIPPGKYRVVVTRGIEFGHISKEMTVQAGQSQTLRATLKRLVDTRGWISTDYHNHSTPSGDNTCGTDDRIINLAAEHIEFAPTTEHNRLYDWQPHIEKLGLTNEINTVPGIELTGSGAHFNAFPFNPVPYTQDNGAPTWQKDPRLNAVVLRDFQGHRHDRWLQLNHPDMVEDFIDRDGDGQVDGGFWGLSQMIDGAETWGLDILAREPVYIRTDNNGKESVAYGREFIWLQMLNRGHRYWCVAVSDAHSVHGNGVGGWRSYVPSSTDDPARIQWSEISRNSKAGRIMVTTGPFLEVQTDDGTIAGGSTRASGSIRLHVKVQCTDWIDIDRIQVLVNGRQPSTLNFTRASHPDWFGKGVVRFERELDVPLSQDSHLIVVAYGEQFDLSTGFGSSTQARWKPCAYHNPIFVDVDGGGFTPNGDLLGWELPVKGLTVDQVKRMQR